MEATTSPRSRILAFAGRLLRWVISAAGILFLFLCLLACTRVPYDLHRWLATAGGECDTFPERIIVLGGSGMPSGPELLRLTYAADLALRDSTAPVLVVHPKDTTTLRLMVEELLLRGVQVSRITTVMNGTNTREQALYVADLLSGSMNERIAIVTAPENMYRTLRVFRKVGFKKVCGVPAFDNPMFIDLRYGHRRIGGKKWSPDVSDANGLRYNFWNYLKLEITCLREYAAIAYYWLNDWV